LSRGLVLSPAPTGPEDIQDTLIRLAFYAAPALAAGERLHVDDPEITSAALSIPLPSRFDPQIKPLLDQLSAAITGAPAAGTARTLRWRMGADGYNSASKLKGCPNLFHVDDWADPHASSEWLRLAEETAPHKVDIPSWPPAWDRTGGAVALLGPGPSLRFTPAGTFNTYICVASALPYLPDGVRVDAVVFTDSLTLLSPARFARRNLRDLEAAAEQGAWLITHDKLASALLDRLSQAVQEKLLSIPFSASPDWPIRPSDTGNVLTSLALPVAARFGQHVSLYGFDGSVSARAADASAWQHHSGHRDRNTVDMRLVHPLSGLHESYLDSHTQRVARMLSSLTNRGYAITHARQDGETAPWQPPAEFSAPAAVTGKNGPAAALYALSAGIDRHPAIGAAIAALGFGAAAAFLTYTVPDSMTDILLIVLFGILAGAGVLCWLNLRKRQDRMANEVRRSLTGQFIEVHEALARRVDALEKAPTSKSSSGDPS
jgi:hypothetical protein